MEDGDIDGCIPLKNSLNTFAKRLRCALRAVQGVALYQGRRHANPFGDGNKTNISPASEPVDNQANFRRLGHHSDHYFGSAQVSRMYYVSNNIWTALEGPVHYCSCNNPDGEVRLTGSRWRNYPYLDA